MWLIFMKGVNWVEKSWWDIILGLWLKWDYFTLGDIVFIIILIVVDLDDFLGILGFYFLLENNVIFDFKKIY